MRPSLITYFTQKIPQKFFITKKSPNEMNVNQITTEYRAIITTHEIIFTVYKFIQKEKDSIPYTPILRDTDTTKPF